MGKDSRNPMGSDISPDSLRITSWPQYHSFARNRAHVGDRAEAFDDTFLLLPGAPVGSALTAASSGHLPSAISAAGRSRPHDPCLRAVWLCDSFPKGSPSDITAPSSSVQQRLNPTSPASEPLNQHPSSPRALNLWAQTSKPRVAA